MRSAGRGGCEGNRLSCQSNKLFARERTRSRTGVVNLRFHLAQIVRARVQRQVGEKFTLGFREFALRSRIGRSNAKLCRWSAKRIALLLRVLNGYPAFALK